MIVLIQLIKSAEAIIQVAIITYVSAITIAGVCGMLFGGGVIQ